MWYKYVSIQTDFSKIEITLVTKISFISFGNQLWYVHYIIILVYDFIVYGDECF